MAKIESKKKIRVGPVGFNSVRTFQPVSNRCMEFWTVRICIAAEGCCCVKFVKNTHLPKAYASTNLSQATKPNAHLAKHFFFETTYCNNLVRSSPCYPTIVDCEV